VFTYPELIAVIAFAMLTTVELNSAVYFVNIEKHQTDSDDP